MNTPAIQYYFGGKLGLYNACVDHLTGKVSGRIAPAVEACRSAFAAPVKLDVIIALVGDVQSNLIDAFFSDSDGQAIRRLLVWEDAEEEDRQSGQFMQDRIGFPVFEVMRGAVKRIANKSMTDLEIDLHALSLMGASMIFHCNQGRVMGLIDRPGLDEGLMSALKAVTKKQLVYCLNGLSGR